MAKSDENEKKKASAESQNAGENTNQSGCLGCSMWVWAGLFGLIYILGLTVLEYNDDTQYAWGAYKYNITHPFTDGPQAISDYIAQVHQQNASQRYMEVDIDDLLDAYESNIHAAGKKYEGKFVKITYAHVCDIGTDSISFQGDGDAVFMHVVSKKSIKRISR